MNTDSDITPSTGTIITYSKLPPVLPVTETQNIKCSSFDGREVCTVVILSYLWDTLYLNNKRGHWNALFPQMKDFAFCNVQKCYAIIIDNPCDPEI